MVKFARTPDVLARVRTAIEREIAAPAEAQAAVAEVERLVDEVNTKGKGTLSKAEVLALVQKNAGAGARVARAYELITGKHLDIPATGPSLKSQLPADWRRALRGVIEQPWFQDLEKFVAAERTRARVEPPPDVVFAALRATPLADVKVILLGQDPYPTAGNATGMSFSVPKNKPIPASLRNMLQTGSDCVCGADLLAIPVVIGGLTAIGAVAGTTLTVMAAEME